MWKKSVDHVYVPRDEQKSNPIEHDIRVLRQTSIERSVCRRRSLPKRFVQEERTRTHANSCLFQATQERAENARLSSFVGALALGDLVKTTLGPKGMNKILQSVGSGEITVTNDGATILRSIPLDNPAAKILVNISKVQDDEVGDGTTSVCVLAAELLREAEKLVEMRIHPQTIVEGFRIASTAALRGLDSIATDNG